MPHASRRSEPVACSRAMNSRRAAWPPSSRGFWATPMRAHERRRSGNASAPRTGSPPRAICSKRAFDSALKIVLEATEGAVLGADEDRLEARVDGDVRFAAAVHRHLENLLKPRAVRRLRWNL